MSKQKTIKTTKTKRIVWGLVACLAAGLGFLLLTLDSAAKSAIELAGSRALGVAVSVSRVDVSFRNQTVQIHGLKIANPPGFENPYLLTLSGIGVAAESLKGDTLVLEDVLIGGLNVFLEVRDTKTNLGMVRDHMKKAPPVSSPAESPPVAQTPQKKLVIRNIRVTDAKVVPLLAAGAAQKTGSIDLPDIHLRDIGTDRRAVTPPEAGAAVFSELADVTLRQSVKAGVLPGFVEQGLQRLDQGLSQAGDALKGLFSN